MSLRSSFKILLAILAILIITVSGCGLAPQEPRTRTELVTVVFVVTATPDPNVTPNVIIITTTPDRTQIALPDGIVPEGSQNQPGFSGQGVTTLVAQTTSEDSTNPVPPGCILHTVDSGDTIFGLADEYGVSPFLMLQVNGYTEDGAVSLQIGDQLIVPVVGCPVESIQPPSTNTPPPTNTPEVTATPEVTETEEGEETTPTPRVSPTITLAPTATNAQVEIAGVVNAGDVTTEGVRLLNTGPYVEITGWTVTDIEGNEYVFTDQIIFSNSELMLFTREGQKSAIAHYWGLEEPVWQVGDVVTLRDADDNIQAVYRIQASR